MNTVEPSVHDNRCKVEFSYRNPVTEQDVAVTMQLRWDADMQEMVEVFNIFLAVVGFENKVEIAEQFDTESIQ